MKTILFLLLCSPTIVCAQHYINATTGAIGAKLGLKIQFGYQFSVSNEKSPINNISVDFGAMGGLGAPIFADEQRKANKQLDNGDVLAVQAGYLFGGVKDWAIKLRPTIGGSYYYYSNGGGYVVDSYNLTYSLETVIQVWKEDDTIDILLIAGKNRYLTFTGGVIFRL